MLSMPVLRCAFSYCRVPMTPIAQQLWRNRAAEASLRQSPIPTKPRKMVRFNATLTLHSPKVVAVSRPRMNSTYGGTSSSSSSAGATPHRSLKGERQRVGKLPHGGAVLPDKRPAWR